MNITFFRIDLRKFQGKHLQLIDVYAVKPDTKYKTEP